MESAWAQLCDKPTMAPTLRAVNEIGMVAALGLDRPQHQQHQWSRLSLRLANGQSYHWDWCSTSSVTQPTTGPTVRAVTGIGVAAALQPDQPLYQRSELSMRSA
jgi:hypothetical protein